jgi:anti-sigma regulatory factor (Ser/Thr protein kinase)
VRATQDHLAASHGALVYHDPDGFVEGVDAFVRHGLRGGDQVLAIVTHEKAGWLREQLGSDADAIEFVDADLFYDRHGPMFSRLLGYLERHGVPGRGRVRIVAEQALALREAADVRAYMRYEAASNFAYSRFDASVLCPYDAARLPDEILRAALNTHPEILENGRSRRSGSFMDPRSFLRQSVRDRAAPTGIAPCRLERPEDIASARALVRGQAQAAGLAGQGVEDLMIAVSEVATNAFRHGEAPRRLWSYVEDGHFVCKVTDAGSGLPDPLAGYFPPDRQRLDRRGLWLAHQLCDIVEVACDTTGTDVCLHMRLTARA